MVRTEMETAKDLGDPLRSLESRVRLLKGLSIGKRKLQRKSDLLVLLGAWESHVHGEAAGQ
jgi:hypothetical protein